MKNIQIKSALILLIITVFGCGKNDDDGSSNLAPEAFELIGVTNGAIQVGLFPTFSWNQAVDPENDDISYGLIIDSEMQPTTIAETNISGNSVTISNRLKLFTTYYWKIRATDTFGNTTESETFSFTTRNIGISSTPLVENAAFSGRSNHSTAVFNDNLYLFTGSIGISRLSDSWTSSNGEDWILNNNNLVFAPRNSQTNLAFNNKLWVIGGSNGNRFNDVWSSSNGANWTLETNAADFSRRSLHASVVFDNKIWVIGGLASTRANDVWSSSDGVDWSLSNPSASFSPRSSHSCVVLNDKLWVIGGFDGTSLLNDVWSSSDGINWFESSNNAPFSTNRHSKAVVLDDKIWAFGEGSVNQITSLWYSTDGNNWTMAIEILPIPFRFWVFRKRF